MHKDTNNFQKKQTPLVLIQRNRTMLFFFVKYFFVILCCLFLDTAKLHFINQKKHPMKKHLTLLIMCILGGGALLAQHQITGRVVSELTGETLPAVTVRLQGTTTGTTTSIDGDFAITVPSRDAILVFSFLGYEDLELPVSDRMDVRLRQGATMIEGVVITGMFERPRESFTGAVTVVTDRELRAAGNTNLLTSLRNIDPSLNILDNFEFGSDPNQLPDITLRGRTGMDVNVRDLQEQQGFQAQANMPLFVLDGFEVSLQRVMDMDQDLVASINILKDASATALWGSRGANGVIVITSRRPEQGRLRVSYRGSLNIEIPDFSSYNLMNAREKLEFERLAGLFESNFEPASQNLRELFNRRLTEVERGVDTYWLRYPVRVGVGQRHSLTLDGGADNFRYSAGIGYNHVAGVMRGSHRTTLSGNLFFQYELQNFRFQNDLQIMNNNHQNSPYGRFAQFTAANPIYSPFDEDGNLKQMLNVDIRGPLSTPPLVGNPLWDASLPSRDDGRSTSIRNNFAVEWNITPDFFVRGRFGITQLTGRTDRYLSREHTSFQLGGFDGENYRMRGSYTLTMNNSMQYDGDITFNWRRTVANRHQFHTGLNFNISEITNEFYSITAHGFAATNMANFGMAGGFMPEASPGSSEQRARRVGGVANVSYSFDQRYFINLSGNMEASSRFGANNRLAPFWSAGVGWNLHNERFVNMPDLINSLRLRASYGTSGSQNFDAFQALTTFRYFQQNYLFWHGAYMMALGNPNLSWQKTSQVNIGLDATLLNGRINITADIYNKMTDALLADINLPTAAGFPSYKANVGEVRNRGVEVMVNAFILRNRNGFTWSVGGSLAHNQNEILRISNALEFLNSELMETAGINPSFLFQEGQSMNTIFAVRSLGICPATGQELFLDRYGNRTYVWNSQDQMPIGINEPRIWGNFRTTLRWRNIALNATFQYRTGGYIYNSTLASRVENITQIQAWGNVDRRALYSRWLAPGDVAHFKNIRDFNATLASSRFVMRENTVRMSLLNLEYEVNPTWLRDNLPFTFLSFGVFAEDLFHISTIRQERGIAYPFARRFSFSVSARF